MSEKIVEIEFSNSDMRANGVYAADQYGNEMPFYAGYTIVKDREQTHSVPIMRERKWCHRVRFEKDRRFDITYKQRPNDLALVQDNLIKIHPFMYTSVRANTATRTYSGTAAVGAYMAKTMSYAMERPGFARMLLGEKE